MKLREYQGEMCLAVMDAWSAGVKRPAIIMPTGSGKTLAFSALVVMQEATYNRRPVILVGRDELVRQSVATLRRLARPHQRIGVIQGALDESRDSHIVVASVQTISRPQRLAAFDEKRFDLIVADEAHWADSPSWRRVLEHFRAFDPGSDTFVLGATATMTRAGKHRLGEIFEEIVFERDTRWAIDQGFLVPVTAQTIALPELDLSKVRTQHGDLSESDLGKAMAQAKAGPLIAAAYNERARDEDGELRRGIVFTPTIACAQAFLGDFRAAGIPCELVIGSTPPAERQQVYAATTRGTNKVLMSVAVLTTGFDLPAVEVAVMARPTKARGLYIQMVGRALRLSPETKKSNALILDVVGASRLGLASIADLRIHEDPDTPSETQRTPRPDGYLPLPAAELATPEEIGFVEVDPFSGERRKLLKAAKRKAWLMTSRGVPFLPSTSSFESMIFLRRADDATWSVCEAPKRGQILCHEHGLAFPQAVDAAYIRYPVRPNVLIGPASSDQLMMLSRCRVDFDPELSKQAASELISVALADRRLAAMQ